MKRHGSLNHIYRLVWSSPRNAWIAVAETTRGRGKTSCRKLIAALLSLSTTTAIAEPLGGQVIAGAGNIAQAGVTTTVTQASQNLSLNWQSFNIAAVETVNFVQPSAAAIAVNRISDPNGTQILGHLNANGQVYLINPNGILFGQDAQVNVGGLVASALDLTDTSIDGNARSFGGVGTGSVVNQGTINVADGSYVALLGNQVSNQGTISAHQGAVALGAGSAATLTFSDNSLVRMQVDRSVLSSVADNGGLIRADGGMVLMNAGAKDALLASVVNNTGVIEARTVENRDGTIVLLGGMAASTVHVGGTLDASAPNGGNGGFIETSAAKVKIANDAKVTTAAAMGLTGTWLIDPVDFTIAATGGDTTGAAVSASLLNTSVEIQSSTDDVNLNDTVAWSSNTLTLDAFNNININAPLNGSGSAGLALEYGQGALAASNLSKVVVNAAVNLPAGPNFSTLLGSDGSIKNFTVITALGVESSMTAADLQGMSGGLGDNYALGADIDATATSGWNAGAGFTPVGTFSGTFDGLGHAISGLTINRPFEATNGLFDTTSLSAVISNVGLVGGSVTGGFYTGGLVGLNYGSISDSHSSAVVAGAVNVGGLAGQNYGVINNSDATGTVSGARSVGGLVGRSADGVITNAHATGAVTGTANWIGGLVGRATSSGTVANSYATGAVSGASNSVYVGGLVGETFVPVVNSYATGAVSGGIYVGGLVGYLNFTTLNTSYSIGAVSGIMAVGGLVGATGNSGTVSNSYWNTTTSLQPTSAGGTPLTSADMQTAANFVGFNFTTTPGAPGNNWVLVNDGGGLNNVDDAPGSTYPMLAAEYSTNIRNAHQLQLMSMAPAASYTLAVNVDAASTANSTDVWRSAGFVPVATELSGFTGTFDGQGHTVSDLGINRPSTDGAALFSGTGVTAVVQNLGLVDGASTGRNFAGLLVGGNGGTINNSYATGTVSGTGIYTGGLVGLNAGVISNSHAAADVTDETAPGGLVGFNVGMIIDSFATGTVSGRAGVGGLVGANYGNPGNAAAGTISGSYATGSVSGATYVGGLVGFSIAGAIDNSSSASNVGGDDSVGGLVGFNAGNGTISDSSASGVVSGTDRVGGLVGGNSGPISSSHASGTVTGKNHSGGLVGRNIGAISDSHATGAVSGDVASGGLVGTTAYGTISNSYATGNVSASGSLAGGLVASNNYGAINDSHATGSVISGGNQAGGLVGYNYGGSISNSYGTGQVTAAGDFVGGLVGDHLNGATISISYATGNVSGADKVGGLVGYSHGGAVSNSYASGNVAGNSNVGGLIGHHLSAPLVDSYALGLASGGSNVGGLIGFNESGVVSDSFWNTVNAVGVNGVTTGATGLNSLQLQMGANFTSATAANGGVDTAWDFAGTWILYEGHTAPLLRIFMTPLTATAGSTSKTYDGTAFTGGNGVTFSSVPDANLFNATGFTGSSQGARHAGSYVIASDAYSHQQGYAITFVNGTLTVDPAALTLSTANVIKTYDGGTTAAGTATVSSGTLFAPDTLSGGSFAFTNKNAGSGKTVTATGVTVNDGNNGGNYSVSYVDNMASTITAASLTVTGVTAIGTKVYDGTTAAALGGTAAVSAIGPDVVTIGGTASGAFANRNVGTGKAITVTGFTLSGADAGNYVIAQPSGLVADITALNLPVSGVSAADKVFDGTTAASLNGTAVVSPIGSDQVSVSGSGSGVFDSADIGTGKNVAASGFTLSGADAGNYVVTQPSGLTADITEVASPFASAPARTLFDGVAQLESDVLKSQDTATEQISLSPATTEEERVCSSGSATAGDGASFGSGDCVVVSIGGNAGPRLQIVNGGVRLPINTASESNQKGE